MTIYLLQYKNYYNRKLGRFDTIDEYYAAANVLSEFTNNNFSWGDGLTTSLVINWQGANPDYLLVEDAQGTISRWYVVESYYNRSGQYNLSLLRDVVADWQDKIFSAPCFVEKGYTNVYDSAIYNSENMTYNQILTSKTPLADRTGCPWIIGFMPKNYPANEQQPTSFGFDYLEGVNADITVDTLEEIPYYDQLGIEYPEVLSSWDAVCAYNTNSAERGNFAAGILGKSYLVEALDLSNIRVFNNQTSSGNGYATGTTLVAGSFGGTITNYKYPESITSAIIDKASPKAASLFNAAKTLFSIQAPSIYTLINKKIKVTGINKVYRIKRSQKSYTEKRMLSAGSLFDLLKDAFSVSKPNPGETTNTVLTATGPFVLGISYLSRTYELEEITTQGTFDISEKVELYDSPYNMWCMPYSDTFQYRVSGITYTANKSLVLSCAMAMSKTLGDGTVYDIQLLPYCPIQERIAADGVLDGSGFTNSKITDPGGNIIGYGFWASSSSGSFTIDYAKEIPNDPIEFKVENECDKYRIVSPTDGSAFDFTATKNNGIFNFNVSYTYKPFQSYIRISPSFNGLYGYDSEYEKRGLILRGDFSLPRISDAWANYKLNNLNYENIFNRQIESVELQNKYQLTSDIINASVGALGTAGTGYMVGSMTNPLTGGIAAGITGALSAGAGVADVLVNKKLREEALDLTKDQFGYQNQNIQALPNTLTKVSAFDIDCSPFPMLEYYTATSGEKQALRDKLLWNGMTIMRIGTLNQYLPSRGKVNYIKGKLIQLEELNEDSHVANAIANEINQGVFV